MAVTLRLRSGVGKRSPVVDDDMRLEGHSDTR
jgi:hypothetical protein